MAVSPLIWGKKLMDSISGNLSYNKTTNTITLPAQIDKELHGLVAVDKHVEAVKRVTRLTGAGLRVSKDYVDQLAERQ